MIFHQIHTPHRLIIGRKTHVQRLNLQLSIQVPKNLLGVKISPNGLPVVIGRVGMFAADYDVRIAGILAVDSVHDGFFRAAVEHLDVQPEQQDALAAGARGGGVDEQRLSRLDLQTQAAAGNAARAEGLLISFATRRSIERGAELGYLADQLRLRFGDALPNAVKTLTDMSRNPVTIDQLLARLEGLEPALRTDSDAPSLERLRRELSNLFVVRRQSAPSPQPRRRLERAKMFLQTGRYEAAIEEVQNMPGATAADQWVADVRRYAAAQRALDLIETAAVVEPNRLRDGSGERVEQPSPAVSPGPTRSKR